MVLVEQHRVFSDRPAWALSDAELCERYVSREREITRLQALAAGDLAEIDARRAYQPEYLDPVSLVRESLGVSGSEAQRRVSEARGLAAHPVVASAFAEARIDRPRVGMLLASAQVSEELFTRDQPVLVDRVAGLSMRDATRLVAYWRQAADHEAAVRDAEHLHRRRHLHLSRSFGGMVRLDGEFDPEGGELVITALASLIEPTNLDPTEQRSQAQRRADALIELCADHLNHGDTPVSGGRRPHLSLTVTPAALQGEPAAPCELDSGVIVTPEAARRIACDAAATQITRDGGATLDVGRTTRTIPPAIRTALIQRDQGCTHPGCHRPHRWCDAHHLIHWADGGNTALHNLVLLCRRHHRMAHEGRGLPRRE
jgi:Domain of unknown function (DUF222)